MEKRKRNEYTVSNAELTKQLIAIIHEANSSEGSTLRQKLLYYSGLPENTSGEFDLFSSYFSTDAINIVVNEAENPNEAGIFGVGETSVYFISKHATPDRWINKFKKKDEIKSAEELKQTLRDFITKDPDPVKNEIIDVSRTTLEELMNKGREVQPEKLSAIKNFKKGSKK